MTTLDWIIVIALGVLVLGLGIWKIVQFCRMTPEQKKQTVKNWLMSAIVAAEGAITTPGAGQDKLNMVLEHFNHHAPLLCRIILYTTNNLTLNDCVEEALAEVKQYFGADDN